MMRILHLIDDGATGGAQTHLRTLIEASLRVRPEVIHSVVALWGDGPPLQRLRDIGVSVRTLGVAHELNERRYGRVTAAVFRALDEDGPFDVFEAHLTWSRLLGTPAALARRVPLRVGFEHGDLYLDGPKFRAANAIHQFGLHRLAVCSAWLADWAARTHLIAQRKLWVLRNCVDIGRFRADSPPSPEMRDLRDAHPGAFWVAAVGTMGSGVNKRMDVVIEAMALLARRGSPSHVVLCGDGPLRPDLEARARKLGIEDRVHFLGMVQDVPGVLTACDAFCHAAPAEPFGIVCLEAQACGLPVVVPDTGGIREAAAPPPSGRTYPSLDPRGLARALEDLSRLPGAELKRLGRAGRDWVVQRWSSESYARHVLGAYDAALGGGDPRDWQDWPQ